MLLAQTTGEVWTNPIIVGLVVGIPSTLFGIKAYQRAEKLDRAAAVTAQAAIEGDVIQRVIDGLDTLVDNLRADNEEARQRATDLAGRLRECHEAYAELKRLTDAAP